MQKQNDTNIPIFRWVRLLEIRQTLPLDYRPNWRAISKSVLRKLRPGVFVQLLAEAPAHPQKPKEEIWLQIAHVGRNGEPWVGVVQSNADGPPARSEHHGLQVGMMVSFHQKDILDVGIAA